MSGVLLILQMFVLKMGVGSVCEKSLHTVHWGRLINEASLFFAGSLGLPVRITAHKDLKITMELQR